MKDMIRFCGLFRNKNDVMSGMINPGIKMVILPNKFKQNPKQPDFFAYVEATSPQGEGAKAKDAKEPKPEQRRRYVRTFP